MGMTDFTEKYLLEKELDGYLEPGERLLWTGKPIQGLIFRIADIFLIPFSLLWAGGAFFGAITTLREGVYFFSLFLIPFVCMGIYITIGRFIHDIQSRKHTIYGITEERVLIRSGIFKTKIKSLSIRNLPSISVTHEKDGRGSIFLGPAEYKPFAFQGQWPGMHEGPKLERIDDVKSVYSRLIEIQRKNKL